LSFISDDGIHIGSAILKLSKNSHGTIDLPLVATHIKGAVQTVGNTISGKIPREKRFSPLTIDSCDSGTEITFLVNGRLKILDAGTNFLSVSSTMPIQVLMGFEKEDYGIYKEAHLFFDTIIQFHRASITTIPIFRPRPELFKDLSAQYAVFNRLTPSAGRDTITPIQGLCDSLSLEFGPTFEKLLIRNQPKSIYYLFLAHTYGEKRHIRTLINDYR
jgi:hypothetical protein